MYHMRQNCEAHAPSTPPHSTCREPIGLLMGQTLSPHPPNSPLKSPLYSHHTQPLYHAKSSRQALLIFCMSYPGPIFACVCPMYFFQSIYSFMTKLMPVIKDSTSLKTLFVEKKLRAAYLNRAYALLLGMSNLLQRLASLNAAHFSLLHYDNAQQEQHAPTEGTYHASPTPSLL